MANRKSMTREERFREIQILHTMLEREQIDHRFLPLMGGFQITWPYDKYPPTISVIEHDLSYGSKEDLLELQVRGHILPAQTAREALEHIRSYAEGEAEQEETTQS